MDDYIKYDMDSAMYWPVYEEKPFYRFKKFMESSKDVEFAISLCESPRVAVQAGGHIGIWPRKLKNIFKKVITFEPDPYCFECILENTHGVTAYNLALGNESREIDLYYIKPKQSGRLTKHYKEGAQRCVAHQTTIDSLDLDRCDFICLDIEGNEIEALDGAELTINAYKPVIQIEAWPWNVESYDKYMGRIGYVFVKQINDDRIYVSKDHQGR